MVSFTCLTAAWAAETKTPAQKLVLVRLADRAHVETSKCFPGVASIAKDCCLGERTVFRALMELEKAGHLKIEHGGGKHKTSVYWLPSNPATSAPFEPKPCHNGKHTLPTRQSYPATMAPQSKGTLSESKGGGSSPRFPKDFKILIEAAREEQEKLKNRGAHINGFGTEWHDETLRLEFVALNRKIKSWRKAQLAIEL